MAGRTRVCGGAGRRLSASCQHSGRIPRRVGYVVQGGAGGFGAAAGQHCDGFTCCKHVIVSMQ